MTGHGQLFITPCAEKVIVNDTRIHKTVAVGQIEKRDLPYVRTCPNQNLDVSSREIKDRQTLVSQNGPHNFISLSKLISKISKWKTTHSICVI